MEQGRLTYQTLQGILKNDYHLVRTYENNRLKLAKAMNQRCFLLRCRSKRVLPGFIRDIYNSGMQHLHGMPAYQNAIKNFQVSVLNLEIGNCIRTIIRLTNTLQQNAREIKRITNPEFNPDKYLEYTNTKFNQIHQEIRTRQTDKFNRLYADQIPKLTLQEDWIRNYSGVELPSDVQLCLSLGPKFNFNTPDIKQTDVFNIIKNTEDCITKNHIDDGQELREKITKTTQRLITQNKNNGRTSCEQTYINELRNTTTKFLKNHPELVITNADKGNVTVVQNKGQYETKADALLQDQQTYTQLKTDPTQKLTKANNAIVKEWYDNDQIDLYTKHKLTLTNATAPKIYFLPKIHKDNIPFRPIVSSIDSPTYNMSKFLSGILSHVVGKSDSHITNAFDFADKIKDTQIPGNHTMVSLDVKSLYTNVPIDLALKTIDKKWTQIKNHTNITRTEFKKGIKLCLDNTYFKYNSQTYRQTYGCAMGSPISSTIANMVMEYLEEECLKKLKHKPTFYYRYVDDIIMTYDRDETTYLTDTFNSFHPRLQFTAEIEQNNSITFLDTRLIRTHTNHIILNWYQKETHSWRYINYLSNHPKQTKINVLNNTIDRALRLSHPIYREQNLNKIRTAFTRNCYPEQTIKRCIKQRTHRLYNQTNTNPQPRLTNYISLPYHNTTSSIYRRIYKEHNIQVAFTLTQQNRHNFTKLKSPTETVEHSNVVYTIPCKDCDKEYIGTTSQKLRNRITQHRSDTKTKPNSTGLATHTNTLKHDFDYTKTKILDKEKNTEKRLLSEMLHIQRTIDRNVNKKTDTDRLNPIYKSLIRQTSIPDE